MVEEPTREQRIRAECLSLAHSAIPILIQANQGSVDKTRAQILKIAKAYETFVNKGTTVGVVSEPGEGA